MKVHQRPYFQDGPRPYVLIYKESVTTIQSKAVLNIIYQKYQRNFLKQGALPHTHTAKTKLTRILR